MRSRAAGQLLLLATVATFGLPACFGASGATPTDPPTSGVNDPFGSVTVTPGAPIQLGTLLVPTGGESTSAGRDAARGVELAIDFLDGTLDGVPGQLLGHPIEIVDAQEPCSEGATSEESAFGARADGLVGVIGPGCTASVLEGPGLALASAGTLMISPTATDAALTATDRRSPFFFRTAYNDQLEGLAVARFALEELEAQRAGVAYDDDGTSGASTSFRLAFQEGSGIVSASGSLADPAISPDRVMQALGAVEPDMVYLDATSPACEQAARSSTVSSGLASVPIVGAGGCLDASFIAAGGNDAYVAGPDATTMQEDAFYRVQLLPAYEEQFGTRPVALAHAQAFDATVMLLDAVLRVAERRDDGTLTIPRTALRDTVAATSGVSGLSGVITCLDTGDCAPETTIAIYRLPAVPIAGGTTDAEPVFTDTVSLDDLAP